MRNHGIKRKVAADDDVPKKRSSARIKINQQKLAVQKPRQTSSKKVFVDQQTALDQSQPSFKNSHDSLTTAFEERRTEFIWLVQKFPHLYNPKDPSYRDVAKKDKSWTTVSEVFGMTANECRAYWKILRDRYCREKKKLPMHVANDFRELMDTDLKFLEPIVQHKKIIVGESTSVSTSTLDQNLSLKSVLDECFRRRVSMASSHNHSITSTQYLLHGSSDDENSLSAPVPQSRDRLTRISIPTNKRDDLKYQSASPFSAPTARPSLSSFNRRLPTWDASLISGRALISSTPFSAGSKTIPNYREATSFSHDGSYVGEEGDDEVDVVRQTSKRSGRNPDPNPLDDALSTLSGIRETGNNNSDIDQLFADTVLEIFRQFSPREKNLILGKFLMCIVEVQKTCITNVL